MGEQLSQGEMNALMQDDRSLDLYGDLPAKEVMSVFLREIPNLLKEALEKFSRIRVGISSFDVVVKDKQELSKIVDGKVIAFSQKIKDSRFPGEIVFLVKDTIAFRIAKTFLEFQELELNSRAIKDLERAFGKLTDELFSNIEEDYGKTIPLDVLTSQEITDLNGLITSEGDFIEISFNMILGSVSCPVYFIMPYVFGSSLSKLLEQEPVGKATNQTARPIQFSALDGMDTLGDEYNKIDMLLDVSMQLTAELGSTRIKIRDILRLGEGSIIELQKLAGEPIDILVNGKAIAKGEVVVIDEYFGVRVTEIDSSKDVLNSVRLGS